MKLLEALVEDQKKHNKSLYSSGPYWDYKNKRTLNEIKRKGLTDFRGSSAGIGTSFADNSVVDIRNELNFKGRIVSSFLSLPLVKKIFESQIILTKNSLKNYLENLAIVYKNNLSVQNLLKKYKFLNTTKFGCIKKFTYLNNEYSTHYFNIANRINHLSEYFDFGKTKTFFEIGGGFGANIHFLLTNFTNIKKVIYLDAVPNIYVGTEYLRYHFQDKIRDYLSTREKKEILFKNNDELEVICIPPWEIEKINIELDHFHNAASFVEMPERVVKNYIKFVNKFKTKEISLMSYDNFDTSTTFDPKLLSKFFDQKMNIFWRDHLINDYNRKEIYLTS
jgi:putative sugar O-methyltransferase